MIELIKGDCLVEMQNIPDKSVDMILADLPYGTTACKWDVIIPFDKLWKQYERIIIRNGAIVLFASQPFTSSLVISNINMFRYSLVWDKGYACDFAMARNKILKRHEDIIIFSFATYGNGSKNKMKFNPQGIIKTSRKRKEKTGGNTTEHRPGRKFKIVEYIQEFTNYPKSIIRVSHDKINRLHPTQKPVELMEYLIKTYTNEGETVLDNTMGSGTTGVACKLTDRNFIGIEKDDKYFDMAQKRINETQVQTKLF